MEKVMTPEEIIEKGFPVIQQLYRSIPNKFPCNAFIRDMMWDEAVNVLLRCSKTYDSRKFDRLPIFIYKCVVMRWADLAYRRRPLERMVGSIKYSDYGSPIEPYECQKMSNYQDVVDGSELIEKLDRLSDRQKAAVLGRINGRTYLEIADEIGTNKENMRVHYGRAIDKLKDMIREAA